MQARSVVLATLFGVVSCKGQASMEPAPSWDEGAGSAAAVSGPGQPPGPAAQEVPEEPGEPERTESEAGPGLRWAAEDVGRYPVWWRGVSAGEPTLAAVDARATVTGPIAFTELQLTVHNPGHRATEARFELALPPTAAVSRLAMKMDGDWAEGELASTPEARAAFARIQQQRRDPAIVEMLPGNRVRIRIFPIVGEASNEILLSYTEEVSDRYAVPLSGLPKIGKLSAEVFADREPPFIHDEADVRPTGNLVLHRQDPPGMTAVRSGDVVAVRITPRVEPELVKLDAVTVLLDTSASRARVLQDDVETLVTALEKVSPDLPVRVVCFDQDAVECFRGRAAELTIEREPAGASNLSAALGWLAEHPGDGGRLLIAADGISVTGEELGATGAFERVDALVRGAARDAPKLASLTRDGMVIDAADGPARIAARLRQRVQAVAVEVAGKATPPHAVQAGDRFVVVATGVEAGPIVVRVGDEDAIEVDAEPLAAPLLRRAAARIELAALTERWHRGEDVAPRIGEMALRHRLLSEVTAFVVLESEEDYARAGIGRSTLSEVARIDGRGSIAVGGASGAAAPADRSVMSLASYAALTERPTSSTTHRGPNGPSEAGVGGAPGAMASGVRDVSRLPVVNVRVLGGGVADSLEAQAVGATWCYAQLLYRGSEARGSVSADVAFAADGTVTASNISGPSVLANCVEQAAKSWRAPGATTKDRARVRVSFAHRERPDLRVPLELGLSSVVDGNLDDERVDEATKVARAWVEDWPADVTAHLALGRTLMAQGRTPEAARVLGSIADWHPLGHAARTAAIAWYRAGGNAPLSRRTFPRDAGAASDEANVGLYAYLLVLDGDPAAAFTLLQEATAYARLRADFAAIDALEEDASCLATILADAHRRH